MDVIDEFRDLIENIEDIEDIRNIRRDRKQKVYMERINPFTIYTDNEFKKIYRFRKETLRHFIEEIRHLLEPQHGNRGLPISTEIQVLSTIRLLAKGNYQSESCELHGFSQSTMSRVLYRVTRAIASKIDDYIVFPRNERNLLEMKEKFYRIANMPNIVGAVDGTLIKIKCPGEYPALYMGRKGFFCLNTQVICNADGKFLDIIARWRGSAHDSRIWDNCSIKEKFENGEIRGILVGDNGYATTKYLLTPVLQPNTAPEIAYNHAHIRTRNVIERVFGQWKNKFRSFFNGMQMSLQTAKASIVALAILHNVAVEERRNGEWDDDDSPDEEDNGSDEELDEGVNDNNNINNDNRHHVQGIIFRRNYIRQHFQ